MSGGWYVHQPITDPDVRDAAFAGGIGVEWENPAAYGGGWKECRGGCEVVKGRLRIAHRVGSVPAPPDPQRFAPGQELTTYEDVVAALAAGHEVERTIAVDGWRPFKDSPRDGRGEIASCARYRIAPAPAEGLEPSDDRPLATVEGVLDGLRRGEAWEWMLLDKWWRIDGNGPSQLQKVPTGMLLVARPVALPQPPATVRVPVMTAIMDGRLSAGSKVPFYGVEWEGTQLAAQTIAGSQNVADDGTVEVLADPSLDAKTASEGGGVPVDQPPAPCTHETVGVLHRERASVGGELRRTEWCESCGAWRSIWHSGTVTRWISPGAADGGGEPTS